MPRAYYNEIEPYAAEWLRRLIAEGLLPDGDVDERDIRDVRPSDLTGYTQCHFFAGIGVWAYALRLAGWPDDRPAWTGSCPCQPFSAAGRGDGFADERHLWPHWFHLIRECRPAVVFGEQVASKDGLGWFDLVSADMEGAGYAIGHTDACAAGFGAPHIRQRLWFVAQPERGGQPTRHAQGRGAGATLPSSDPGGMGHDDDTGLPLRELGALVREGRRNEGRATLQPGCASGGLADAERHTRRERRLAGQPRECASTASARAHAQPGRCSDVEWPGPVNGFWRDADWIFCRDGKWRPVEPGSFPLAHGAAGRVAVARPGRSAEEVRFVSRTGTLRAFGNAIVPQVAQAFIEAYCDARGIAAPSRGGAFFPYENPDREFDDVTIDEAIQHIEAKGWRLYNLGKKSDGRYTAMLYNTRHTRVGNVPGADVFSATCLDTDPATAILGCLNGPMSEKLFHGNSITADGVREEVWRAWAEARKTLSEALRP